LKYISPEIEWAFVGIDERWREGVRVVFRKRALSRFQRGDEGELSGDSSDHAAKPA
jgi:hypothetical protein